MKNNESFASEVWLISGIFHSLPGVLALEDGKLIFTAIGSGTYWERGLKKIENKSGSKNFAELLLQGKKAQLFTIDISEIQKITFPFIYFLAGAHITFRKQKYRLSFIQPNNTTIPVYNSKNYIYGNGKTVEIIQSIGQARKVGKIWKALLTI